MADQTTIGLLSSEIVLVGVTAFVFIAGAFARRAPHWWPLFNLIVFAALLGLYGSFDRRFADHLIINTTGLTLSGPLVVDLFGLLLRQFVLVLGLLLTLLYWRKHDEELVSEKMGMIIVMMIGTMIICRANDLVLLFLGLETVSIPTYVLLFLGRRDRASAEATTKYFFLSILSSAILLYGFSFLYGLGGTTTLVGPKSIQTGVLAGAGSTLLVPLALILVLAGLGFKVAAVPFHYYAPDVFQGTTNANAGMLAVIPKLAGFLALIRVYVSVVPPSFALAWQLPLILGIATMTLGNVCALWQRNLRRLLAFSSIAHSGYLLMGVAASVALSRSNGTSALIFYLIAYSLTTFTMFAALAHLESRDRPVSQVEDLAGLGSSNALVAAAISVAMFSFAGIPVFAGFWGKYGLFTSVLQVAQGVPMASTWFLVLAVAAALNAAIAAAYYLRIIATMFFHEARGALPADGGLGPFAAMLAGAMLVMGIGLFPGVTMQRTQLADESLPHGFLRPSSPTSRLTQERTIPDPTTTLSTSMPTSRGGTPIRSPDTPFVGEP